jgi:formiminoglutamase
VTQDPRWTSADSLLRPELRAGRLSAALIGISTFQSSLTPRSGTPTPAAIRTALERFATFSWQDEVDLAELVDVVDYGDVHEPDAADGKIHVREHMARIDAACGLLIALGGDNSMTFPAMSALAGDALGRWGLITLDAHLDLREGESNGSPVRQLLEAGLDGNHVAQLGLADFSNSASYALEARKAGITIVPRFEMRNQPIDVAVARALEVAGEGDRPIYVDIDFDVADRASVPACPAAAPGGLSADDVRRAARLLARDPRVRAIDLTEIDVERDTDDQRTVRLAALVVLEVLAGFVGRAR